MFKNTNISDSILFLGCLRETLSNLVEETEGSDIDKVKAQSFIMNEATDHEVLSLIVNGEMPEHRTDVIEESILFDQIKDSILENYNLISEVMNDESITSVMEGVDTLTPFGISTAAPILEYVISNGLIKDPAEYYLKEDIFSRAHNFVNDVKTGWKVYGRSAATAGKKARQARVHMKGVGQAYKDLGTAMVDAKAAGDKARITDLSKKLKDLSKLKGELASTQKKLAATEKTLASKTGIAGGAKEIISNVKALAAPEIARAKAQSDRGATAVGAAIKRAAQRISKKTGISLKMTGKDTKAVGAAGIIGGAVLASLLMYASVKTYKRFFSKAAKACGGQSGAKKTGCMKAYRVKALSAQISDLKNSMRACADAKDPSKCSKTIAAKLTNLNTKLRKEQKG